MSDSEVDNINQQSDNDEYYDTSDEEKEDSMKNKPIIKIGSFVEEDVEEDVTEISDAEDIIDADDISDSEDNTNNLIMSKSSIKNRKTMEQKNDEDTDDDKDIDDKDIDDDDIDDEDTDDEDTDDEDDGFLQKLDREIVSSYIEDMHPESKIHNYDEVKALANVVRNKEGNIIDELHRTIPILTKFEKTRILGIRAKQIDEGGQPLIMVPDNMIDGYTIALDELVQKAIPFIIKRPLPNGGSEYWRVADLELI